MQWLFEVTQWQHWERALSEVANVFIATCTLAISACLILLWHYKKQDARHPASLLLFSWFLFMLGIARLIRIFFFPDDFHSYHIVLVVDVLLAITALVVFFVIPFITVAALRLPSINAFEKTLEEKEQLHREKEHLEKRVLHEKAISSELNQTVMQQGEMIKQYEESKPLDSIIEQLGQLAKEQGERK